MLRLCNEQGDGVPGCGRVYDDVHRSTICPHDPIGLEGAYCRTHDQIACAICRRAVEDMAASEEPACPSST